MDWARDPDMLRALTETALHERRMTLAEVRLDRHEREIQALKGEADEIRQAVWRFLRGVLALLSAFALDQGLNGGAFGAALKMLLSF